MVTKDEVAKIGIGGLETQTLNVSSLIWMIMSYVFFGCFPRPKVDEPCLHRFFFEIHRIFLQVFIGTTIWHQNVPFPMAKAGDGDRKATGRAALWQRWTFLAAWNVLSYPHCDWTESLAQKIHQKIESKMYFLEPSDSWLEWRVQLSRWRSNNYPIILARLSADLFLPGACGPSPKDHWGLGWLALFIVKDVNKQEV